jgi:DNA ligase (NAD+)
MEGFKEKSAENLLDSIQQSKGQRLSRLIYGLGIRHVGKYAAQLLAQEFTSLHEMGTADLDTLKDIHGLGDKTAEAIVTFFSTDENQHLIQQLRDHGVKIKRETSSQQLPLSGKKFVFTGGLSTLSRPDASELVTRQGGIVVSSVSKDVDYVVVGEKPGSKKQKAEKLSITLLNEEEFKELVQ